MTGACSPAGDRAPASMRLVPEYIENLVPYKAGKSVGEVQRELGLATIHKLASNENPLGASPRAMAAMREAMTNVHLYPETSAHALVEALSVRYRVKTDNVIVGSGSEGIMANLVRTFLHGDEEVLTSEGTFVGFMILARAQGVPIRLVPLCDHCFDLEAMAQAITPRTKIVYLANPNNPTGTIFDRRAFEAFHRQVPSHVLIILDEAYYEFVPAHDTFPDSMHYRYDNVITLRTFSKAYGLAGIRIGYGLAHEALIAQVRKVKLPFEPSSLAQAAGLAALDDTEFLQATVANNRAGMIQLTAGLSALGAAFVPSHANFVMLPCEDVDVARRVADGLLRQGVVIRPLDAFGLPHCLRVSIGLPFQNEAFLQALGQVIA